MFNWLKNLFNTDDSLYTTRESEGTPGIDKPKITPTIKEETAPEKTDLNSMKKNELLDLAKKSGKKVNASMKKSDIIAVIENG